MDNPINIPNSEIARQHPGLSMSGSPRFWEWLNQFDISIAFTTYQTNRLFLVGRKSEGRLAVNERLFDKPMGLYASKDSLYMACRSQIWVLENRLGESETYLGCDRLFVPSIAYTTGDLNIHDVAMTGEQELVFVNTDFSCLATLRKGYSFEPLWRPPFITGLYAEDRCHLNGLAIQDGKPAFVTACSRTDSAAGWRGHRVDGGVVIHIPTGETIASGLSMPHSPRWYRGKLWLLNSGTGEFGYVDAGGFVPIAFCPGFVRGLAFIGDYALIGLSKLRSKTFAGLTLETRLAAQGGNSQCGLRVIDLNTGGIVASLEIDGVVEELFDIVVLPNTRLPKAVGFQDDDIDRLINFPDSGGMVVTKPTVKRPSIGKAAPTAGLPRASQLAKNTENRIKFQKVFHLNPDNLLAYETMTYPSLQARWQTQAQRGELLGVSASVAGEMVGLAVAEQFTRQGVCESQAELISLFVLPAYRHHGIGTTLVKHLQKQLAVNLAHPFGFSANQIADEE